MDLENWYALASAFLCVFYIATLVRVCLGSKQAFSIKLIVMLLCSNLAHIFFCWTDSQFFDFDITIYYWIHSISYAIYLSLFCIAHWIFAFEYYKNSYQTPLVLEKKTIPRARQILNKVIFWVFICFNILFPMAYSFCNINFLL